MKYGEAGLSGVVCELMRTGAKALVLVDARFGYGGKELRALLSGKGLGKRHEVVAMPIVLDRTGRIGLEHLEHGHGEELIPRVPEHRLKRPVDAGLFGNGKKRIDRPEGAHVAAQSTRRDLVFFIALVKR